MARPASFATARPARARREDPRVTQTRELVYAATIASLAEVGAARVSVELIAARSGVARSTIYRRWPDQSILYLEAFRQLTQRTALPPSGEPIVDLENHLHEVRRSLNDPTHVAVLIAVLARVARDRSFAKLYREILDERHHQAATVVRAAIETGALRSDCDVTEVVVAAIAPLHYRSVVLHERLRERDVQAALEGVLERYGSPAAVAAHRARAGRGRGGGRKRRVERGRSG
jgi:AcrR family transcriptional regulator